MPFAFGYPTDIGSVNAKLAGHSAIKATQGLYIRMQSSEFGSMLSGHRGTPYAKLPSKALDAVTEKIVLWRAGGLILATFHCRYNPTAILDEFVLAPKLKALRFSPSDFN